MRRIWIALLLLGIFLGISVPGATVRAQVGDSNLVIKGYAGEPPNGPASRPAISRDGRVVVFSSLATNLVPGDQNGVGDVFYYDRLTGEVGAASITPAGVTGNGVSFNPTVSADGRWVIFESLASDLVPGDSNNAQDIFAFDRLTRQVRRVSETHRGEPANGSSAGAAVSGDGRYIAFYSEATNLAWNDENDRWDVFVKDMITGGVSQASASMSGEAPNGNSGPAISISMDGRYIAFASEASNLVAEDQNGGRDVFVYDRVRRDLERVPVNFLGEASEGWGDFPQLDDRGNTLLMVAGSLGLDRAQTIKGGIYLVDRQTGEAKYIATPNAALQGNISLQGDGASVIFGDRDATGKGMVMSYSRSGIESVGVPSNLVLEGLSLSKEGGTLVFLQQVDGQHQLGVLDLGGSPSWGYLVSGKVTDALGNPLRLVTVTNVLQKGFQASVFTDRDGRYALLIPKDTTAQLSLEKDGFVFSPVDFREKVVQDRPGVNFIATPEKLLEEARLDLGMPYSYNRGCSNPFVGCDGPFHGFYAGYCTDLIIDAFEFGLDYTIQFELEKDARANPEHYYRWRNARNAHDMWRFFSYQGMMESHLEPYLPGDVVFFDWSGDGEIDHVALVSDVNEQYRPTWLYDATGKTEINPDGLAAELRWQPFYESTVRGHARWNGNYLPYVDQFPPGIQVVQISLASSGAELRITDDLGRGLSAGENTLPNGMFFDLTWEKVASLRTPVGGKGTLTLEVRGTGERPVAFQLTAQVLQGENVTQRFNQAGMVSPGQVRYIPIQIHQDEDGEIELVRLSYRRQLKIRGLLDKE